MRSLAAVADHFPARTTSRPVVRIRAAVAAALVALTVPVTTSAHAAEGTGSPFGADRIVAAATAAGVPAVFPGQLNVKLTAGATLPQVTGVTVATPVFPGAAVDGVGDELAGWLRVEVAVGAEQRVSALLEALPQVAVVERVPVRVPAYEPNDPRRREQWHLDRVGAQSGWNVSRGNRQVRVGVIDTQFDTRHPELAGVLSDRNGRPGVDRYADGCATSTPYSGHGTLVAGVAAATTDNQRGIASAGFGIGVAAAQAGTELEGICAISGSWTTALRDMADAGIRVVNLSFASPRTSRLESDVIRYAVGRGTLVVAAAGNEGSEAAHYPAAHPLVVGVAATDEQDRLWSRSNRGPWVDLAAPGVSLLTLCPGSYCYASGTSTAAPVVAAAATLLATSQPDLAGLQLRNRLLSGTTSVTGRAIDPAIGYGRVRIDTTLSRRAVRLYGRDRISTAQAVVRESTPTPGAGSVERVVLVPADTAGDRGWTVTLPAAGLLADGSTAIVMTGREKLHDAARNEIDRLIGRSGAILLPGSPADGVSVAVERELAAAGYDVQRLGGASAAETAARLGSRIVSNTGATAALVARRDTFADALSLSGPAAARGLPLLFVDTDRVPESTCSWLKTTAGVDTVHLAGGTGAIAPAVEQQLRDCAAGGLLNTRELTVTRDAGKTRVETAVAIAKRHFGNAAPATVSLANGFSWPDAVTGGALAASHGAPVLTTTGAGELEPAVRDYLARGRTTRAYVLGGSVVVSNATQADLQRHLG